MSDLSMIVSYDTIIDVHPPFCLTPKILDLVSQISLSLGRYEGLHAPVPQPHLRRLNKIKTIQGSLAIEGNTLDLEQVTALFENKRILGPKKDILEVQNAILLHEQLRYFDPVASKDLLKAHAILMKGLTSDAGKFRSGSVGILKGSKVSHIAPPARRVPELMEHLFLFLKQAQDISPLIQGCVFHYELEFIHPFSDGNGRMGRFWQHLIFTKYHEIFEYLPVESLIKERQRDYYLALERSDKKGDFTRFIEFSLAVTNDALAEFLKQLKHISETPQSRLQLAQKEFKNQEFTRKDYLQFLKTISTATASRDLALGVSLQMIQKSGTQAVAKYRFSDTI